MPLRNKVIALKQPSRCVCYGFAKWAETWRVGWVMEKMLAPASPQYWLDPFNPSYTLRIIALLKNSGRVEECLRFQNGDAYLKAQLNFIQNFTTEDLL